MLLYIMLRACAVMLALLRTSMVDNGPQGLQKLKLAHWVLAALNSLSEYWLWRSMLLICVSLMLRVEMLLLPVMSSVVRSLPPQMSVERLLLADTLR